MPGVRSVISTMADDGSEAIGPETLLWHYPHNDIINGSLLTVESNHFGILKSRGAIIQVYETGQYPVQTGDRPLIGSFQQAFYGGQSPWQYEVIYINRSKLVIRTEGVACSKEMAETKYVVSYYVHVESRENALQLLQHMPVNGHTITAQDINRYAAPIIEQAINRVVQVTPLASLNERMDQLTQVIGEQVQQTLSIYGITLNDVKVLVTPTDDRMRELIGFTTFGLTPLESIRYYTALWMATNKLVSAPNAAVGSPFQVGGVQQVEGADGFVGVEPPATDVKAPAPPSGN